MARNVHVTVAMANELHLESNPLLGQLNRQLKFPPFLTLYAGGFALWAWCAFVFHPLTTESANQLLRAAVPFWAVFTACFFIVTRQSRPPLKVTGWVGLAFSMLALAVTVAELSGH
ncbi:MAG TPA: hypothetical protein VMP11_04980 [Verrucomicrobiae bacterium]|nr:hypothetical protein [Verrucomicrobiae bacterium]